MDGRGCAGPRRGCIVLVLCCLTCIPQLLELQPGLNGLQLQLQRLLVVLLGVAAPRHGAALQRRRRHGAAVALPLVFAAARGRAQKSLMRRLGRPVGLAGLDCLARQGESAGRKEEMPYLQPWGSPAQSCLRYSVVTAALDIIQAPECTPDASSKTKKARVAAGRCPSPRARRPAGCVGVFFWCPGGLSWKYGCVHPRHGPGAGNGLCDRD